MKMMYLEKQKNAVASGKSAFHISKFQNIRRFQEKNGANCETPFPVFFFLQFLSKAAISCLIKFIFEAN